MPIPTPQPNPIPPTPVGPSKIDLWIKAIIKMEGAKPSRNNPGNLRFIGQKYAVNDNGFCKFDTYEHGYNALKNLLLNACMGKSKNYDPRETIYEFYAGIPKPNRFNKNIGGYAPASDGNNPKHYAEFVAGAMKVPPTTIISHLLA